MGASVQDLYGYLRAVLYLSKKYVIVLILLNLIFSAAFFYFTYEVGYWKQQARKLGGDADHGYLDMYQELNSIKGKLKEINEYVANNNKEMNRKIESIKLEIFPGQGYGPDIDESLVSKNKNNIQSLQERMNGITDTILIPIHALNMKEDGRITVMIGAETKNRRTYYSFISPIGFKPSEIDFFLKNFHYFYNNNTTAEYFSKEHFGEKGAPIIDEAYSTDINMLVQVKIGWNGNSAVQQFLDEKEVSLRVYSVSLHDRTLVKAENNSVWGEMSW